MILVTGGAGYIGSHVVRNLVDKGYQVLVLDNLTTGHLKAVDKRAIFIAGDVGDPNILDRIFQKHPIQAVMHFAGSCLVGESVEFPLKYFQNNVAATMQLLQKMLDYQVHNFIFSSTCAIYGTPNNNADIDEQVPPNPINPYGMSKLMVESILKTVAQSDGLRYVSLRYFNVAGAHTCRELGEDHNPETHLIPNILKHLQGKTTHVEIHGNDYPTPDGTCIRDYIHVMDLSAGHILALELLLKNQEQKITETFNLGNEQGTSVLQMISICEQITGKKATVKIKDRRAGDPPRLIASSKKIRAVLGWTAKFDINQIIKTAWDWHQKHPEGYQ
ncbi:UDP-glucose 4-epimerase GalE [Neobacillus notoginsengisoli]|uniref:UDP-glucose 4-epimerase n=1 Tax=Neobacillus notoginsengisoli TaxID=1578198 RepID=A0A417Z090_9BACI|nr:UDP-glucose 4-epimerase GalE [Neobacillus notoginsengisoli]RHW43570.1 UDP-glucose 4-epimerase GalE [Neobacillus notoginsengisoli]